MVDVAVGESTNIPPETPKLASMEEVYYMPDGYLILNWSDCADSDGTVDHFRVRYSSNGSLYPYFDVLHVDPPPAQDVFTDGYVTNITLTDLKNETNYFIQVCAVDDKGSESSWSNIEETFIYRNHEAPSIISLSFADEEKGIVRVKWNTSVPASMIKEFKIEYTRIEYTKYIFLGERDEKHVETFSIDSVKTNSEQSFEIEINITSGGDWYFSVKFVTKDNKMSLWSINELIEWNGPDRLDFLTYVLVFLGASIITTVVILELRKKKRMTAGE